MFPVHLQCRIQKGATPVEEVIELHFSGFRINLPATSSIPIHLHPTYHNSFTYTRNCPVMKVGERKLCRGLIQTVFHMFPLLVDNGVSGLWVAFVNKKPKGNEDPSTTGVKITLLSQICSFGQSHLAFMSRYCFRGQTHHIDPRHYKCQWYSQRWFECQVLQHMLIMCLLLCTHLQKKKVLPRTIKGYSVCPYSRTLSRTRRTTSVEKVLDGTKNWFLLQGPVKDAFCFLRPQADITKRSLHVLCNSS